MEKPNEKYLLTAAMFFFLNISPGNFLVSGASGESTSLLIPHPSEG